MTRTRCAVFLVLLALAPQARADDPPFAIAGDWKVKRFADGTAGKPLEIDDFKELTATGDKLFIRYVQNGREKAAVMRYSLGEQVGPAVRAIELRHRIDGRDAVYYGICRCDGAEMAICVSIEAGVRAAEFAAGEKKIFIVAVPENK